MWTGRNLNAILNGSSRVPLRSSVKGTRVGGYVAKINAGLGLIAKFHGRKVRIKRSDWCLHDKGKSVLLKISLYRISSVQTFPVMCVLSLGSYVLFRPRRGTTPRVLAGLSHVSGMTYYRNTGTLSMCPLSAVSLKDSRTRSEVLNMSCTPTYYHSRFLSPSMHDVDMVRGSGLFGYSFSNTPDLIEAWSPTRSLCVVQGARNPTRRVI